MDSVELSYTQYLPSIDIAIQHFQTYVQISGMLYSVTIINQETIRFNAIIEQKNDLFNHKKVISAICGDNFVNWGE